MSSGTIANLRKKHMEEAGEAGRAHADNVNQERGGSGGENGEDIKDITDENVEEESDSSGKQQAAWPCTTTLPQSWQCLSCQVNKAGSHTPNHASCDKHSPQSESDDRGDETANDAANEKSDAQKSDKNCDDTCQMTLDMSDACKSNSEHEGDSERSEHVKSDQNVLTSQGSESANLKTKKGPSLTTVNIEIISDNVDEVEQSDITVEAVSDNELDMSITESEIDRNILLDNFVRDLRLGLIDRYDVVEEDEFDEALQREQPASGPPSLPPFPVGDRVVALCEICVDIKELHLRVCCWFSACDDCLTQYFTTQIKQGIAKIECLNTKCNKYVHRDEILARLDPEYKDKFYRFLVEANREPNVKTCPQCCHIMTVDNALLSNSKVKKHGLKVVCPSCFLVWCFPCQAPYHEGVSCKDFRKGDRLLRQWAKEHHYGQANAQKCPRCKVYIQRSTGCDHMQCTRCKTNFCYRCGDRYRQLRFLGDHYSKLSIFGCKYRFKPDQPAQRKLIRGAVFGGQILIAPIVGGLAVAAGAIVLGLGAIALPFYGGFKIRQKLEERKRRRRRKLASAEWRAKLEAIRKKGDPYLENWHHLSNMGYVPPLVRTPRRKRKGEELEISMPQTNTDNLEELIASCFEHSRAESLDIGFNSDGNTSSCSSSCESEAGGTITEVKVITENVDPALLQDSESEAKNSGSEVNKDSGSEVMEIGSDISQSECSGLSDSGDDNEEDDNTPNIIFVDVGTISKKAASCSKNVEELLEKKVGDATCDTNETKDDKNVNSDSENSPKRSVKGEAKCQTEGKKEANLGCDNIPDVTCDSDVVAVQEEQEVNSDTDKDKSNDSYSIIFSCDL